MSDRSSRRHPPTSRRSSHRRLVALLGLVCLLFALVLGRLAELQIVSPDRYIDTGLAQRVVSTTVPAGRGSLLDRNGTELALSIPQRTVFADPAMVTDPAGEAELLAPILDIDRIDLEAQLRSDGRYVVLAHTVPDPVARQIDELALPGIAMFDEFERFTPSGDLARSLLGGVSVDGAVGTSGLEAQFDEVLGGEPGELTFERSKDGSTIVGGEREITDAEPGEDVVLTIDRALQYETEQVLMEAVAEAGAQGGTAIVSDPETGEVLSLANVVRAETDEIACADNNAALTTVFEPGSVNKVITAAGAIEEGIVSPTTNRYVPGSVTVGDHEYTDAHERSAEMMSVTDILAESSNVGTIGLAQDLGGDRMDGYLRSFGFGRRTGLGFPNESAGLMLDREEWSGTSIGSIPLGQGISVTAMQMLGAYNVLANDGTHVAPRLVDATIDADGARHELPARERRRVVSPATAVSVRHMMTEVVSRGTGQEAAVPGYTVAGKTGTARKPQPGGGYTDASGNYHYVSSFAGFVPAEDPQLSVIVIIDDPSDGYYASDVAAPAFSQLARYGLRRFQIPPSTAGRGDVPQVTVDQTDDEDDDADAETVTEESEASVDETGTDETESDPSDESTDTDEVDPSDATDEE